MVFRLTAIPSGTTAMLLDPADGHTARQAEPFSIHAATPTLRDDKAQATGSETQQGSCCPLPPRVYDVLGRSLIPDFYKADSNPVTAGIVGLRRGRSPHSLFLATAPAVWSGPTGLALDRQGWAI